jgi:Tfp pilus assembly protein PilN
VRAVNLLPPDLRGASRASAERVAGPESTGGAGPFVVLGVLAACLAGATGYVLTTNDVKQRQAELADVSVRQQALAGQAAKLKPYADFDALAKARVQTVRDLAGSRFDWEQVLSDLSRAVPSDVTLKSLSGDVSTDTGGAGSGGGSLRGAIAAPAITLTGCAPGQTQVARLMARLHDVDGVTRVSLSKSDAEKVATTSDADVSPTQARNAAPCGTGKRPAFEVIAFFENVPAAVSAAPATASGAAAATPTPTPGATATATPGTSSSTTSEQGAKP